MNGHESFLFEIMFDREEYIIIQQEIVGKHNLQEKSHNGHIYARVIKGMYGLPQAGRITHYALVKHIDTYRYQP